MEVSTPLEFPDSGFDGLIFDLDGTLVDSMPAHFAAWCEALADFGAAGVFEEDVFYAMGGRPTRDIVEVLNGENGLKLDADAVSLAKRAAFLRNLPTVGLHDLVVSYARSQYGKVPIAIASGGTRVVVERTLQAVGLSDLADEVVTTEDVAAGKPAPDIYLEAASRLGVAPERCVALEDAPAGILAAQTAGMTVVAVPVPLQVV